MCYVHVNDMGIDLNLFYVDECESCTYDILSSPILTVFILLIFTYLELQN